MILTLESQCIEFKSESVNVDDLADEFVAFANSDGGELWLGIEDDGTASGLSRSYEEDVMNLCRTACIPPIIVRYEEFEEDSKRIAKVTVPGGKDKPYYTSRNRYYIRVGSTKRVASREELIRLFQASGAVHYDVVEVERAKITDLDIGQIGEYFTRYNISFFDEPESERLRLMSAADLVGENGKPTIAGMLVFGLAPERLLPQSGIDFAHFAGDEITADLLDKQNIRSALPRQVENGLAAIKSNLPVASTIQGARRVEAQHYPDRVFRELLVNACVHRNYSITGSNIRVLLFQNRLEVRSPGRLPNTVRLEKLPVGTSFARNPVLVRLMENLGYVDKLGRGLPMVWQEARKLNQTVEFSEEGEEFVVTLPLPQVATQV